MVGLNPSTGRYRWKDSTTYRLFYRCLREEGLADAHVTDAIKIRAARNDVPLLFYDSAIAQLHREYLAEEVKIVKPTVVVIMSRSVLDVLRGWHFVVPDGRGQWAFEAPGERKAAVKLTVHPAATRWPKRTAETGAIPERH